MRIYFVFLSVILLSYTILGFHDRVNRQGAAFPAYQKEIRREKLCIGICAGLPLFAALLVCFEDF